MTARKTSLSQNIVAFCRFLRQKGFALSAEEEATALHALSFIEYGKRENFKLALRAVFCRSKNQLTGFDELFDEYWRELAKAVDSKIKETGPHMKTVVKAPSFKSLKTWLNGNRNKEKEEMALYSMNKSLSQKDFSQVPDDELDELLRFIKALSRRLAAHINRRYKKSNKNDIPDLRRTLRKNMRRGGELLEIAFRKPKQNRTKLVVICDVSKSMDLYASFLLQFMYAFQQVYSKVETFAFSTCLQCITSLLKQNDFTAAMQQLNKQNSEWSSGTRIGESLHAFIEEYSKRSLDKRTIVIILSDGWDTGNIPLLEDAMQQIHARAKKVIWLNPLGGYAFYRPDVAGMQAALPYIDVFAPVHNAESLRSLSKWL